MKKLCSHLKCIGFVAALAVLPFYQASAFETRALVLPRVELITPGMSRTIRITQESRFPQGVNRLVIVALGYGGITITMQQDPDSNLEGDLLMMTGMGMSSAGIVPVFKFGIVDVTLTAAIEIGNMQSPFGIIWLSSWVHSATSNPPYKYQLDLTASLGFNNEL